jgi:cytochrome c oxidase subunit 2
MRDVAAFAKQAVEAGRRSAFLPALLVVSLPGQAYAQDRAPPAVSPGLSYMTGFGPKNYPVVSLLWGEIILSLAVVAIIALLVVAGIIWRRRSAGIDGLQSVPLERSGSGLAFIYVGISLTFVALVVYAVWNYEVLAAVAIPPANTALTVDVTGHRWWWEVRYESSGNQAGFTTANEIRIPVGKPVKVKLTTADVIHSFWVPALTGKMDTIPGQTNVTWLQADKEGIYRGQCTEYCGLQHAHMAFLLVAEPQDKFEDWRRQQLRGPKAPPESDVAAAVAGQQVFTRHCAVCHTVRGTMAMGKVGPDLSHLMERKTIAAGTLPNTIGALSGWISNPQHIKPGNLMPTLDLSGHELASLRDFLRTLQ